MFLIKLIFIALLAVFPLAVMAEDPPALPPLIRVPDEVMAAAKAAAAASETNAAGMNERVQTIMDQVSSAPWQAQKQEFLSELRRGQGLPEEPAGATDAMPSGQHRLVMFISGSVPVTTLRRYARDLEAVGGIMVLRGMKGGMKTVQPTLRWMSDVLRLQSDCEGPQCPHRTVDVIVDPQLFRDHEIVAVPALTWQSDFHLEPYCQRGEEAKPISGQAVVYGDASLYALTEEIYRLTSQETLKPLLQQLER